jgi:hypothetical protein
VEGCTPPEVFGGFTGGIVGVGVVIGAELTAEFGGGVDTEAPMEDPTAAGGTLPAAAEATLHVFDTLSNAYPSGQLVPTG